MECCGLYLKKKEIPATPEALMRSRYTAFCENRYDYIKKTMQGKALSRFGKSRPMEKVTYLKLEISDTCIDAHDSNIGYVSFKAYLECQGKKEILSERSEFHLVNGRWLYTDAEYNIENISRGDQI